ncbi:unnamed protein product [Phytomonas sp. Hart1]|nr:unnamed protein product [Phytomonas sp. Hart1]|eukprot:CCW71782.1 unnamed protein product [Phytomonas sp. isolate Hart1]
MSIAGRYRHIIKLGEGTYGAVYKATERDTGRIIAFKRMMSSSDDEGVPGTAIREICLLKELKHDNIVSMYEVLFEQPKITLIFELCDCDLKKFLEDQPLGRMDPQTEVGPGLRQMFLGLQYLHRRGVVHRDLKPQNIFLNLHPRDPPGGGKGDGRREGERGGSFGRDPRSRGGAEGGVRVDSRTGGPSGISPPAALGDSLPTDQTRADGGGKAGPSIDHRTAAGGGGGRRLSIKLGDFGLARVNNIPVKKYSHEVVTLWYRSPDVMMGSALYSFPVDIWSMGAIFFEIVTGKVLFSGRNEEEQLFRMFFLLGSPTHESWPSMFTYPKVRNRLESLTTLATQLYHAANIVDNKSCKDSHNSLHNSSCNQDFFFDFIKKHLIESMKNGCCSKGATSGTDHSQLPGVFSNPKVNSYQLPAELWFPNPMLDAFLAETGFRDAVGDDGVNLLRRTLEYEPSCRITCDDALQHPFLVNVQLSSAGIMEQLERDLMNSLQAAGI